MPDELYYEENHFWVKEEGETAGDGHGRFWPGKWRGKSFMCNSLKQGRSLQPGKSSLKFESGKWLGKVFAPVSGDWQPSMEQCLLRPIQKLIKRRLLWKGMALIKSNRVIRERSKKLIRGREAVEKWLLADIEKYKK